MTRARAKWMKGSLHGLVMELQEKEWSFTKEEPTLVHIIQASIEANEGICGDQVKMENPRTTNALKVDTMQLAFVGQNRPWI